jgi:glycosyltransferase involved in cell wall biosynthesis
MDVEDSLSGAQMVLAIVTLPPPTHGQAVVTQAVMDSLSATNVRLKVIDTSPGSLQRGFRYHRRRIATVVLRALPAIIIGKSGVLYTIAEAGLGIWYNFFIVAFARTMRLKIVIHHHSAVYAKTHYRRFDWLSRLAGKRAIHVALDEFMARDFKARYSFVKRVVVAHNAAYVERPTVVDRGARKLTCGFMSNLSREKGLDLFLDCLRAARRAGLDLQAILAGPATSREAEKTIADARSEFGSSLNVLGSVAGPSKEAFFRSIDIFFFPSRYKVEGQPLVILEAMSYGVPVVSSQQGYCAELVGQAGASAPISKFEPVAVSFVTRCNDDVDCLDKMRIEALERFEHLRTNADAQRSNLIRILCSSTSDLDQMGL